jgi:PAS domain S-box-containing protein
MLFAELGAEGKQEGAMIHYPHEGEFRERRQLGERRRTQQARRKGDVGSPASNPDSNFTDLRDGEFLAFRAPDRRASALPLAACVPQGNDEAPSKPIEKSSFRCLGETAELHRQGEETVRVEALLDLCEALSPEATGQILHELRVHQIELELQNEELRGAQVALEIAKSRYFDLYDLAPVGYCTLDAHLLILEANLTLTGLLGAARSALIKRPISKFILPEDQDIFYLTLKQLLEKGEPEGCELRMLRADGTLFWALLETNTTHGAEDEPMCRLVISDITERRRMEAENRQLQRTEGLGRMAGAIAHHFNNQLQAVMASLELLGELPPGSDPTKFLTMGKRATERAAEVSRLMLVYLGQTSAQREPRCLAELCLGHLPILQSTLPTIIGLEADCPSPGPAINANTEQIQQVLANLVTNAREAIGDARGSIRLSLNTCLATEIPTSRRLPCGWKPQEPDYACLEVADTGCGIGDADMEKLFDPFFTTKFAGRGLGLSVVLGLVQAHGGAVTVASKRGKGSSFRVYFPIFHDAFPPTGGRTNSLELGEEEEGCGARQGDDCAKDGQGRDPFLEGEHRHR